MAESRTPLTLSSSLSHRNSIPPPRQLDDDVAVLKNPFDFLAAGPKAYDFRHQTERGGGCGADANGGQARAQHRSPNAPFLASREPPGGASSSPSGPPLPPPSLPARRSFSSGTPRAGLRSWTA